MYILFRYVFGLWVTSCTLQVTSYTSQETADYVLSVPGLEVFPSEFGDASHPPSLNASPLRGAAAPSRSYGTASSVFAAAAKAGLSQAKLHRERAQLAAEHGPYGPRLTPNRAGAYYPRRCNFEEA